MIFRDFDCMGYVAKIAKESGFKFLHDPTRKSNESNGPKKIYFEEVDELDEEQFPEQQIVEDVFSYILNILNVLLYS